MKSMDKLFEVFNTDRTKNGEVTWFVLLEVKINGHKKQIDTEVMDLNGMNMFLGYDWLVKYNLEVNWDIGTIWFTRCSKTYRTQYQDIPITLKNRRVQPMNNQDNRQQEIGKEPNPTNPEDLPEYIQPFIYLFNKKKFEKLPDQWK